MSDHQKQVTSLDEIRAQAAPDIITISGFRPGTTINVAIRPVDLGVVLLSAGIGNPFLGSAIKKAQEKAREGKDVEQVAQELKEELPEEELNNHERLTPIVDAVCIEALVEPTFEQLQKVAPLKFHQKWEIYCHAIGDMKNIAFFR